MNTSHNNNHETFDVWLFAVDLVNLIFFKSSKLQPDVLVAYYPNFICNGFSETLKKAVHSIKDSVGQTVEEDFAKLQLRNNLRPEMYKKYIKDLRKTFSDRDLDAETFLSNSVSMALMAYHFHTKGIREAQISAVSFIAENFNDCKTSFVVWESFDEVAEKIVGFATSTRNLPKRRSQRKMSTSINYFASPEMKRKDKVIIFAGLANSEGNTRNSTGRECSISSRRSKSRTKDHLTKESEIMPSLCESFEYSLENLSTSSTLSLKPAKDEASLTPVDSSPKWRPRIKKERTFGNSLERQIFKLSPIRVKNKKVNCG